MNPTFLAAAALLVPALVQASTFGSLSNFDAVNDTGRTAHGFEIELEGIRRSEVLDVFGLNRNFGTPSPGDVVRYGMPSLSDLLDGSGQLVGTRITYSASFSGGVWSTGTPSGVFNTPGESCWTFGNVGYPNVPCDHFGVSTLGTPTATRYSWLVEGAAPGSLVAASLAIPAVSFTPPAQPAAPVVAVIQPQRVDPVDPRNNAFWVKIVTTTVEDELDLNELMGGQNPFANPAVAALNDKVETEIEWQVLQPGFVDEVSKAVDLAGNPGLVVRYEFFRYLGRFDDEGLVDPLSSQVPRGNALNEFVGNYLGEQVAGFNAVAAVPPAPVPEPHSLALAGLGLGMLALRARRRGGLAPKR